MRVNLPRFSARRICAVEYYYAKLCSFVIRLFHSMIYKVFDLTMILNFFPFRVLLFVIFKKIPFVKCFFFLNQIYIR